MADNKINVGGRLHSIATGNILAGADEILDDSKGKKQSEINIDIDNALADRYTKDETYDKTELNSLITTPDVQYITVSATEQTTVITDILPSVGASNTIYRVGKWNGTQYNNTVHSEYAWDGSAYVLLDVKQYGIDDEPIAESNNLVKSSGVAINMYNSIGDVFAINSFWGNRVTNYTNGQIGKAGIVSGVKLDGICVPVVGGTVYMFSDIQLWTHPNAVNKICFYSQYPTIENCLDCNVAIVACVDGKFTAPVGAKYMVISCEVENCGNNKRIEKIKDQQAVTPIKTVKQASLSQSENITIQDTPNTYNLYMIAARCEFEDFGSVELSKGTVAFSAGRIEIDDVNIKVYDPKAPLSIKENIVHGLTISDFLNVSIITRENPTILGEYTNMATLKVNTTGGTFIRDIEWIGSSGNVKMTAVSGNYENVEISFGGAAFEKDIWLFGDSYINYWPKYAFSYGMRNIMLDGYSGRGSLNAFYSFMNALKFNKPKIVVWMLGMNDGDSEDSINTLWKQYYDLVKDYCNLHKIEFIPATTPNTPSINNTYKNTVIKESGYDYLDIANAVGATERNSAWYDGLISGDNVHPSNKGSEVIANYICTHLSNIVIVDDNHNAVKKMILSESYIISGNIVRDTDDNISSCDIQYIDGTKGKISINRNNDGDVYSANYTYGTDSYTLTVTRNSDGDVTSTSIIKN